MYELVIRIPLGSDQKNAVRIAEIICDPMLNAADQSGELSPNTQAIYYVHDTTDQTVRNYMALNPDGKATTKKCKALLNPQEILED